MAVTLPQLLLAAQVNRYMAVTFFKDSQWTPPVLYIQGEEEAAFVERNYAPAMRELVPALEVKPLPKSLRPTLPVRPKAKPLWKAGYQPKQEGLL